MPKNNHWDKLKSDFSVISLLEARNSSKIKQEERKIRRSDSESISIVNSIYDLEYDYNGIGVYRYINALMVPEYFYIITKVDIREIGRKKILDVGAGSNNLMRYLRSQQRDKNVNWTGMDPSAKSAEIIDKDGFNSICGIITDVKSKNSYDYIFLSYFIDYDLNQRKTFHQSVELIAPGGKIILEGKFPVRPFALTAADVGRSDFVTRGVSACGDIERVFREFRTIAKTAGKPIKNLEAFKADRFVFSRFGLSKLPSYFLTIHLA